MSIVSALLPTVLAMSNVGFLALHLQIVMVFVFIHYSHFYNFNRIAYSRCCGLVFINLNNSQK